MVVFQGSIHNIIQSTKGVNNHHNIQTVILIENLLETFNSILKLIHNDNTYMTQGCSHFIKKDRFEKSMLKGNRTE